MQIMNFSSANCKNCYKCVRTCTVKAIEIKNDQAHIVEDRCIACGHCLMVCPQNAREVTSDIDNVLDAIESKQTVIAELAPAFRGFFKDSDRLVTGLYNLGFDSVEEVSIGAEAVSEEYEKIIKESNKSRFITSCCPSAIMYIEKYFPSLIDDVLPVVSPMIAHGKIIRKKYNNPYVVFIGPCISKKSEALSEDNEGVIDAVITFDEILKWLEKEKINYMALGKSKVNSSGSLRGDKYPLVGGILEGIKDTIKEKNLQIIKVHGLDNCKVLFEELCGDTLDNVCIEVSACNESCIGGPGACHDRHELFSRLQRVEEYISNLPTSHTNLCDISQYNIDFSRSFKDKSIKYNTPSEDEIRKILNSMGKYSKSDELNCSACGYDTCRDKAIAVYNGMSQIEMCVHHMKNLAEKLSNEIFNNSPNAILILDNDLNIKDLNKVAEKIFGFPSVYLKGMSVSTIIKDDDITLASITKQSFEQVKVFYKKYNLHAYRSIIYLEKQEVLLIIYTDITKEENQKIHLTDLKENTLNVTQGIIDKQMRVAQEIASLLGETTAETKVALVKLKKILHEEKDI